MFFAETQNKLIFAVTHQTAAELIVFRADADKPNMALTAWKGAIVRKQDIFTAKNYLTKDEIDTLNRLVVIFLEAAELRAKDRIDMTLDFWRENVDRILEFSDQKILKHAGNISTAQMEQTVREIYEHFDKRRKVFEANRANLKEMGEIEELKDQIEKKK